MKPTKVFLNQTVFLLAIFIFLFPVLSHAQVKEIISEGTYNMGDGETPSVAESRALLNAKRVALEQAGTYVESYSKVINLQLTEDEIQVLASGLMEVEILDKKRTVVGDGIHFWVKIKAKVNLDKAEELANRIKAKDRTFVEDYKRTQVAYDKSQKDIEELKKQLAHTKGEKEKKQVEEKIVAEERLFQANEWFDKGYQYGVNNEHEKAIEAFTSAIALNPNFWEAYNNRGIAYDKKGQHDRAIEDYNRAIAINPNDAYHMRGNAYLGKGQYDKAISDYGRAISINPQDAETYNVRGLAYTVKGQYDRAVEDYNKAIALNPNDAAAYNNRGLTYHYKGQYDRAIEDYGKAIALDPNVAEAYLRRGIIYAKKGIMSRAISDFQKACDMGNEDGCKNLQIVLQKR